MKKWLITLLSIWLILLIGVYVFIPGVLMISEITTINCPKNIANRFLIDESKWLKWWPKQETRSLKRADSTFSYNEYTYHISELFTDKINILTTNDQDTISTSINIIPVNNNAIVLHWQGSMRTSSNPVTRILQYRKGVEIKKNMTLIFQTLQSFLEETSNVYGFPIKEIISKDSTLIATKFQTKTYPATKDIYSLIDSMKKYIVNQGASETDHPMLRITKVNDSTYESVLAIPTNKALNTTTIFFFVRFVPYKTLTGTVKGGINTIDSAFKQMEIFVDDHQRTSMAVPFQSLVTDRSLETDSLKWITIICQPVS